MYISCVLVSVPLQPAGYSDWQAVLTTIPAMVALSSWRLAAVSMYPAACTGLTVLTALTKDISS